MIHHKKKDGVFEEGPQKETKLNISNPQYD